MDPDENLSEQRKRASKILQAIDHQLPIDLSTVMRLAELVVSLDEWLTRGGSLPKDWKHGP